MINNLDLVSSSAPPRGIVRYNGKEIKFSSLSVATQNYYIADTHEIEIPLYRNPPFDIDFWSQTEKGEIEIYVGYPDDPKNFSKSDLDLIHAGISDNNKVSIGRGVVTLHGRDYSQLLIDTKATEILLNKTTSQVATAIAKKHGLTPVVKDTKTQVGTYSKDSFAFIVSKYSEWDLLTFFAQQEQFNVFVKGKELHYQPKPTGTEESYGIKVNNISIDGGPVEGSISAIEFDRSMTLARDVVVKIESFDIHALTVVSATAKSVHKSGSSKFKTQTYTYNIPGLSLDQANAKAKALLKDITEHEILMTAQLPGDNLLDKQSVIKVIGTSSKYDQNYFIQTIQRSLRVKGGYKMSVMAKNHDTNTEVTLQ